MLGKAAATEPLEGQVDLVSRLIEPISNRVNRAYKPYSNPAIPIIDLLIKSPHKTLQALTGMLPSLGTALTQNTPRPGGWGLGGSDFEV